MNLKDLKTGWRVQTRNGDTYVVLRDCETQKYGHQDVLLGGFSGGFLVGSYYDANLFYKDDYDFDIMKIYETTVRADVFDSNHMGKLVWERTNEPKDMTLSEIERALGYPVRIVRDEVCHD